MSDGISTDTRKRPALCLVDAHMHLDLMEGADAYVARSAAEGVGLFSCSVTPAGFVRTAAVYGDAPGVCVGLGLHPWWVEADGADAAGQLQDFLAHVPRAPFVGEVGLDFAPAHAETADQQTKVLEEIFRSCADQGGKVVSLHCVRAYDQLFSLMESSGVLAENTCILHWFSGTHDDLLRAVRMGCWFSVGERLLSTKRGRAYVRTMPTDRLLLETDAPPEGGGVQAAYDLLAEVRGTDVAQATTANACRLFGW